MSADPGTRPVGSIVGMACLGVEDFMTETAAWTPPEDAVVLSDALWPLVAVETATNGVVVVTRASGLDEMVDVQQITSEWVGGRDPAAIAGGGFGQRCPGCRRAVP